MRQDYLQHIQKYNSWVLDDEKYSLIMGNDWDSILSCALLQEMKGWDIGWYYDFNSLYKNKKANKKIVAVDIPFTKNIRSFDNHVTLLNENDSFNKKSINLNIIDKISQKNYEHKYCGSTLLQLYSIYNKPLPSTEKGKMILLAIDSAFLGYYSDSKTFKDRNIYYIKDVMQFEELIEIEEKYNIQDFYKIIDKYNLKAKISIKDGKLKNNGLKAEIFDMLEIKKPKINNQFELVKKFKSGHNRIDYQVHQDKKKGEFFSFNLNYKYKAIFSKI